MTGELHRALPGYAHDDTFLELVAGLHVAIARFDELLARHAPIDLVGPSVDDVPGDVVDALLGAIAIRERLGAVLAETAQAASGSSSGSGDERGTPRDVVRDPASLSR